MKAFGSKHVRKDTSSSVRCDLVLAISTIIGCKRLDTSLFLEPYSGPTFLFWGPAATKSRPSLRAALQSRTKPTFYYPWQTGWLRARPLVAGSGCAGGSWPAYTRSDTGRGYSRTERMSAGKQKARPQAVAVRRPQSARQTAQEAPRGR